MLRQRSFHTYIWYDMIRCNIINRSHHIYSRISHHFFSLVHSHSPIKTPRSALIFVDISLHSTCVCTRTNWEAHTTLTEALNTPLLPLSLLINFLSNANLVQTLNGSQHYPFIWQRESYCVGSRRASRFCRSSHCGPPSTRRYHRSKREHHLHG
jgi:hypothetical protein